MGRTRATRPTSGTASGTARGAARRSARPGVVAARVAAVRDLPLLAIAAGARNHVTMNLGLDRMNLGLDRADPSRCLDTLTAGRTTEGRARR